MGQILDVFLKTLYFEIILDSQEVMKLGQGVPMDPSPSVPGLRHLVSPNQEADLRAMPSTRRRPQRGAAWCVCTSVCVRVCVRSSIVSSHENSRGTNSIRTRNRPPPCAAQHWP